jgi:hypothetical protein
MEGSGSRDIANYYLGGVMPSASASKRQTVPNPERQAIVTDPLDVLNPRPDLGRGGNEGMTIVLSAEEQSIMMKSIQEIFELEESQDEVMGEGDEEEEPEVDLEDQARRTERLKGVLSTLAQLWWSDSEDMDLVAEKLADGSRDRECIPS